METKDTKPENPPAFPLEYTEYNSVGLLCSRQQSGMTLRDYIAAKAIPALIQARSQEVLIGQTLLIYTTPSFIIKEAFEYADEFLKARQDGN